MKAKKIAAFGVFLPMALLCACGGGAGKLTLDANWYADGTETMTVGETLEYSVKGDPNPESTYALKTSYPSGTYKTTFTCKEEKVGEKTEFVYSLYSETVVDGVFELGGATHTFQKSIKSTVLFRSIKNDLQPLRSTRVVKDTLPNVNETSDINKAYREYEYTQTVVYNGDCSKATLTLDYADANTEDVEKEIKLNGSSSLFDNEAIIFALRALDLSAGASFRTVDFARRKQIDVNVTAKGVNENTPRKFAIGSEEAAEHELNVATVELAYSGSNAGYPWTLEYACKADGLTNTYRNVLLSAKQTTLYGLCDLVYTLERANFS